MLTLVPHRQARVAASTWKRWFLLEVAQFLDFFDDLNTSADFKKNEFILKHFFQSKDPAKRREIDVFTDINSIDGEDDTGVKIPAELKMASW